MSQRSGGQDRWFHADQLGSSRFLTDGTGQNVPTGYRYDAFGGKTASMGPDATTQKYAGGWGYQSDVPGGLQQLGFRLYDPAIGRFISPDPIGFAGGMNLYGYVGHNPVGAVDPPGPAQSEQPGRGGSGGAQPRGRRGPPWASTRTIAGAAPAGWGVHLLPERRVFQVGVEHWQRPGGKRIAQAVPILETGTACAAQGTV